MLIFFLALAKELQPYLTLKVEDRFYQFQSACFGLSPLPEIWQGVMKIFAKKWRQEGIMVFIYLDDILILNTSEKDLRRQMKTIVADLEASGMGINLDKSILEPTQRVTHLGFDLNLRDGQLEVPGGKLKSIRKELGKVLVKEK